MTDRATAWQESYERVVALARGATPQELATRVPATPGWTARDLIGHVIGVGAEHVAGIAEPDHNDGWTAKTVRDRADRSLDEVLDEWAQVAPRVTALLADGKEAGLPIDLGVHEHDLRGALGQPGARDSASTVLAVGAFAGMFDTAIREAVLPAIRLCAEPAAASETPVDVVVGADVSDVVVTAPGFELFRGISGRRSERQVRSWDWPVAPDPYVALLARSVTLRDTDLAE